MAILAFLVLKAVFPLHVQSEVCMAPFHVRSKVCIAPLYGLSKDLTFAPHLEGSNVDFALHMEGSNADFAPHMEQRNSFIEKQKAKMAIFYHSNFLCPNPLYLYMIYVITFENKNILRESTFKVL